MPPVDPNTLAADVRDLLGNPAKEGECWEDQPVCTPDPRVTAQLISTETEEQVRPWRLVGAERGDMLLTPGGPAGFIGAMLGQLDPPEKFSHMGIVVKDETEIRHCTVSADWLKRYPHKHGDIVSEAGRNFAPDSINDAPTDGFESDQLRYGWPGTITQTVEAAYLSFRNWGNEAGPHKVHNAPLNEDFRIAALTFKPEPFAGPEGTTELVWPVLVKRCFNPAFTSDQHRLVREAVNRVAEAVTDLRGHYRFYSYTRADIGLAVDGPAVLEATEPAPLPAGCTGRRHRSTQPTQMTSGAQCASLVWLAVQKANRLAERAAPPLPQIVLDSTSIDTDHIWLCADPSYMPPTRAGADRIMLGGAGAGRTADGLYYYPRDERLRAGEELYQKLHDEVRDEVVNSVELQKSFDDAVHGTVGKPLWIVLNLLMSGVPLTLIPAMLGVTDEVVQQLVVFFSDMPDDVANQMANAFCSDDCSIDAKDSTAWKDDPGHGETVSPDGILRYWSPPASATPQTIVGLWGRNVVANAPLPPVRLREGPPPSTWQISTGPGHLGHSSVVRVHGGSRDPAPGATVRIGCVRLTADKGGIIREEEVPAGVYWCEAWWDEPVTGVRWSSKGEPITIVEGQSIARRFELFPPPDNLRAVLIHVHMDNVNRKPIGKDWWDHPDWTLGFYHLGEDFADPILEVPEIKDGRDIDDWGRSEFNLSLKLVTQPPAGPQDPPQWSVRVGWKIRINEADEDDPWTDKGEFIALPKSNPLDPGTVVEDDLKRLDVWPVRSHIRIEVHNNRA